MSRTCPRCQSPLEPAGSALAGGEEVCSSCGSRIPPTDDRTQIWGATAGGRKLGRFELLEAVGAGAFGTVYKARDAELHRIVAVKTPRAGQLTTSQDVDRFLRESRSVAQLYHAGIVPVFEIGQADGLPFLVSEFVDGVTLADYLTGGRLSFREAARLIAQLADALQYAHERGVVHRDVKPGNVMLHTAAPRGSAAAGSSSDRASSVDESGRTLQAGSSLSGGGASTLRAASQSGSARDLRPRLMDFGLARNESAGEVTMTTDGQVLGTPAYMSPEQAAGEARKVDGRSDVYSLGVMLYELLTGETPFRGNARMLLHQVLHDEPRSPRRLNDRIPLDLETICLRAMQKSPARRYASADELAADLRRWLNKEPILARPVSATERALRWCQRQPLVAGLSLTVAALIVVALAGISWQWSVAAHERDEAETQRDRVSVERDRANTERDRANAERDRANAEQARAENERRLADAASAEARAQEAAERWGRYASCLNAAGSAMQLHNIAAVQAALEAAPREHRAWEWRHFASQLDTTQHVISGRNLLASPAVFSADGRIAASRAGHSIRLCDNATGEELAVVETAGLVGLLTLSQDGGLLAYKTPQFHVVVWDVQAGRVRAELIGHTDKVAAVAFSPDGQLVATGSDDLSARIWDLQTGACLHVLYGHEDVVNAAQFSPDGARLLTAGWTDGIARIWDVRTGDQLFVLPGHASQVSIASFNPQGDRIVTCDGFPSNLVRLWDAADGRQLAVLRGHTNAVESIVFSPDGELLATAGLDQTVRMWSGRDGTPRTTLEGHSGWVYALAFSPDGRRLVSTSQDQTVRMWDVAGGFPIAVLHGPPLEMQEVAYFAQGGRIAASAADESIAIWDAALAERSGVLRGHESYVYDMAFHPDGRRVASASWDGTARLWDATTGRELRVFRYEQPTIITSVALDSQGRTLATLGRDDAVRLWDVESGAQQRQFDLPTNYWQDSRVAFSPDGELLAAGGRDHNIYLWRVQGDSSPKVLSGHTAIVRDLAFSPDGRTLASVGEFGDHVRIWDASSGEQVRVLEGSNSGLYAVTFSPDGRRLAASWLGGDVRLWETETWEQVALLEHGVNVYGLAFSPDNRRLACACANNVIRLWDATHYEQVAELFGHRDYVHQVAWSPDGSRLASGSGDNSVRIWDALPVSLRARPADVWLPPQGYVCFRAAAAETASEGASAAIVVDGRLDEPAWQAAPWTADFVDIEGDLRLPPRLRTRAKLLWDDRYLYVGAELEEPHLQASFTEHDSYIFHADNDFEVFFDPDGDSHGYGEYEMNALNTGWDLRLSRPYKDGGQADDGWEFLGLLSAVHLSGTLNDPRDKDDGWSIELAFPWETLNKLIEAPAEGTPPAPGGPGRPADPADWLPADGQQWRINFSRVQWRYEVVDGRYVQTPGLREDNWVWSPQGKVDMHRPETWGYVQFSRAVAGTPAADAVAYLPDVAGPARHLLHRVYYAQRAFRERHARWATTLEELELGDLTHESLSAPLSMEVLGSRFEVQAQVQSPEGAAVVWHVREDAKVWRDAAP